MSKISFTPNASGTGTFTIASPDSNTNRTLTLPDETGTMLTSVSAIPAANLTGALPAIDGSALTGISTTPSTVDVLTATAGATANAVGTYALLRRKVANVSWTSGDLIAGTLFNYATLSGSGSATNSTLVAGYTGATAAGTWMALTDQYGIAGYYPYGIFLRKS